MKRNAVGVTLVEMLIVVALTILLMSIIAEVFVLASETFNRLRAVSGVNLKVRSVETIIRTDLASRRIREVQPPVERVLFGFNPGPDGLAGTADDIPIHYVRPVGIDPTKNLGYFMLEENSPADEQGEDTDDVLAFTTRLVASSQLGTAGIGSAYVGRYGSTIISSQEAEIVYFLRNGTLYRRVLLVGVPQPPDTPANNPSNLTPAEPWYAHYDVSARPAPTTTPVPPWPIPIVNTLGDLSYRSTRFGHRLPDPTWYNLGDTNSPPRSVPPIQPGLAADFPDCSLQSIAAGASVFLGNGFSAGPLEFIDTAGTFPFHDAQGSGSDPVDHNYLPSLNKTSYPFPIGTSPLAEPEVWFGRPTLRESSAVNAPAPAGTWDYPDNSNSSVFTKDPRDFDPRNLTSNMPLTLAPRRTAEDVVLTNVISFDIKVWDPDAIANPNGTGPPIGAYVDLGKFWPGGSGSISTPGPSPSSGTPSGLPGLFPTPAGQLPFTMPPTGPVGPRPFQWPPRTSLPWLGPDGQPGVAGVDDNGANGIDDAGEIGFPGSDDITILTMCGADRKPGIAGVDDDGDGIVDNLSELFWLGSDDVSGYRPGGRGFGMPFGWDSAVSPPFAISPGVGPDGQPGVATVDDDGVNGTDDPGELGWPGSDDIQPMLRCPFNLARTYDTWCTAYTKPTQYWYNSSSNLTLNRTERVLPVAPPYIVPLRGIQIKIRFVDPDSRLTRETTIIQELH